MPKRNGAGIELLADPTRRRLIAEIALRPRRPSKLATDIGLSRPATSRQLMLLRDAGLIRAGKSSQDRRVVLFSIEPRARGPITAWLAGTEIGRPFALRLDDHHGEWTLDPAVSDAARPIVPSLPIRSMVPLDRNHLAEALSRGSFGGFLEGRSATVAQRGSEAPAHARFADTGTRGSPTGPCD